MDNILKRATTRQWIFRVGVSMCFIGHGSFGILTKEVWCNYFGVFGIDETSAFHVMPIVGGIDVLLGIVMLIFPMRIIAVWLVFWGLFTALLRPLSGEPVAELFERAGNFGVPVLLLILTGINNLRTADWFKRISEAPALEQEKKERMIRYLRIFGFLLLAGHGWLNLIGKQALLDQYFRIGFSNPNQVSMAFGLFEVGGALLILLRPSKDLVLLLCVWKMLSEVFYPAYPLLEWVERGGSYAILIGLYVLLHERTVKEVEPLFVVRATSQLNR